MCVIVHKPRGHAVPRALLEAAAVCNGDGWGLMGIGADGAPCVERHRTVDVERIATRLDVLREAEVCVHLRQRTRGACSLHNTHPIGVNARFELMHNGTLALDAAADGRSDSWQLATRLLAPLLDAQPQLAAEPAFVTLVEAGLTPRNRVVLLDREARRLVFFNRRHGVEREGLWISGWHWIERGRAQLRDAGRWPREVARVA